MQNPNFLMVADRRVAAAWAQVLAEEAGDWRSLEPALPCPAIRRPLAPPPLARPASRALAHRLATSRRRGWMLPLVINGVLAVGIALVLAGAPLLAAWQLRSALNQADAAALTELVDWPTLRDNLSARMAGPDRQDQPAYLQEMAREVAAGLGTPAVLHAWLRSELAFTEAAPLPVPLGTSGAWQLTLGQPRHREAGPLRATLMRDPGANWRWRLADLELPPRPEAANW